MVVVRSWGTEREGKTMPYLDKKRGVVMVMVGVLMMLMVTGAANDDGERW